MKTFEEAFRSVIVVQEEPTVQPLPETVSRLEEFQARNREIIAEITASKDVEEWLLVLVEDLLEKLNIEVNNRQFGALCNAALTAFGNGVTVGIQMERQS